MTDETQTLVRYRLDRAREALEEAALLLAKALGRWTGTMLQG